MQMTRTRSHRRPTFFWQGVLIMLPVVVLAVASLASLRLDEQAAEQAARNKAAANVQSLARALRLTVDEELHRYLTLQNVWMLGLRLAAQPSVNYPTTFPDEKLNADVNNWEQAYPGFKLADCAAPQGFLLADGRQIEPPEIPAVPRPPQWFRELSPEQRDAWQTLRQTEVANAGPDHLAPAVQAFIETGVSPDAGRAANCLTQTPEALLNERLLTEVGISFADIACYRLLRTNSSPISNRLLDAVWRCVFDNPSFVAPALLDLAEGQINRADAAMQEKVVWMRQIWNGQSKVRAWLEPLRRLPQFLNGEASKPWSSWTGAQNDAALALFEPVTIEKTGSEGVSLSGRGCTIRFVPRPVVEAIFARALAENRFLIPAYATATITVQGVPLRVTNGVTAASAESLLGRASQKFGKYFLSDAADFELSLYLTSRDQMLAVERRHSRLFGLLIAGTALTALAGLFAAWRAFRQQLQLNELKSNFVSSVSHELRAPIASVRLMGESLESGKVREPRKQQEYFGFIVQECRRLTALIENVLDFSRIEQGRKQYELEPTDLHALTRETVRLMEPCAAEKGVRLVLASSNPQSSTSSLELDVDGRAIQQALVNLIDNAIKHSPNGAEVTVGLDVAPVSRHQSLVISHQLPVISHLHLWVEDHGPGIPPDEHEKIFERFYRRGSELRRETQGVGIGLSIVKHVVEAHGGRVTVRSAVGEGSRFTLVLPMKTDNRKPAKDI